MLKNNVVVRSVLRVILHLIFWCGVLLFYTIFFGTDSNNFSYILSFSLFLMPITIALTYVSIYNLIPEYLIKKKYRLFILYSIFTLIISAYLIILSIFYGLIYLSDFQYSYMAPISRSPLFVSVAVYLVVVIVSAFKLLKLNLIHAEKTKNLETKILETQLKLKEQELNYLKMQIHPHFLFNTLNTMYGFALKKADETPEMILKLSNLLDYLLYQVDKPFVLLKDDINHIEDYIALEKLRFSNTLDIKFHTKNISNSTKIAPMLLLPFIENSFKHGIIKNGVLSIIIGIECTDLGIHFSIENSSLSKDIKAKGIGLKNLKKRLTLLYKDNYELSIINKDDIFMVNLFLKTNNS